MRFVWVVGFVFGFTAADLGSDLGTLSAEPAAPTPGQSHLQAALKMGGICIARAIGVRIGDEMMKDGTQQDREHYDRLWRRHDQTVVGADQGLEAYGRSFAEYAVVDRGAR